LVRLEKSIEIRASPEKVWEMLALDRLPEWDEGYKENLKSVEYTSEVRKPKDKYKVGAFARGIPKKKGEEWSFESRRVSKMRRLRIIRREGGLRGLLRHLSWNP